MGLASCMLRIPFPFLLTYLTFLLTAIPVISVYPVLAAVPWICGLMASGDYVTAVLLAASQQFLLAMMSKLLLDTSSKVVPAWATGLSVVLGFERFGIQAFVVGPLTLSVCMMLCQSSLKMVPPADDEAEKMHSQSSHTAARHVRKLKQLAS